MITTVQCSICSQLNNKPRVVVTDFRLHHTCSIMDGSKAECQGSALNNGAKWLYSLKKAILRGNSLLWLVAAQKVSFVLKKLRHSESIKQQ